MAKHMKRLKSYFCKIHQIANINVFEFPIAVSTFINKSKKEKKNRKRNNIVFIIYTYQIQVDEVCLK